MEDEKGESDDDDKNLNCYECKGDYEEKEKLCVKCPVKDDCIKFQPYFKKAKELDINIDFERNVNDIIADVKAKVPEEKEDEKPRRGKKRKANLPF